MYLQPIQDVVDEQQRQVLIQQQTKYLAEQEQIIIEDYFTFASKIGKIIYARWCAGGYEPSSWSDSKQKYVNCYKKSFDCGGVMKAYLYVKWLISKAEMVYYNSETMYQLGLSKNPKTAKRGDFMYRRWYNDVSSGNMSTHFSVVSRDYTWGGTMWIYDNVVPWWTNQFHERAIQLYCNTIMCHHLGKYRIYIASNGAYSLARQRQIEVTPWISTSPGSGEVLMSKHPPTISLKNATIQQDKVLQYMWKITSGTKDGLDFILTMYWESKFNPHALSATKDGGICQFHIPIHWDRRNDSITKQVDDCWNKWKLVPDKSKYWFAYNKRNTFKSLFIISW